MVLIARAPRFGRLGHLGCLDRRRLRRIRRLRRLRRPLAVMQMLAVLASVASLPPIAPSAGALGAGLNRKPAATGATAPPPAAPSPGGDDESGEVTLPLEDYLALTDSAEKADAARVASQAHREPPVGEVVVQRMTVEVVDPPDPANPRSAANVAVISGGAGGADTGRAIMTSEMEVLVQGHLQAPVPLPLAGMAVTADVQTLSAPGAGTAPALPSTPSLRASVDGANGSGGAAGSGGGGAPAGSALYLVAPEPGRYRVRTRSVAPLPSARGISRLPLARIVAPVAVVEIGLPANLQWECGGAVLVSDRPDPANPRRRLLTLTAPRGLDPVLSTRRHVAGDESATLLAQTDVTTVLQLRPEGVRRQDIVLYDVSRGALGDMVVELPPGLDVERAGTDEGPVDPIVEGRQLVVHRKRLLQGGQHVGFLVVISRPVVAGGALPLGLVRPQPAPHAWYLAVASTVPGKVQPLPPPAWSRVDLDDLPRPLSGVMALLEVNAAWRVVLPAAAANAAPASGAAAAAGAPSGAAEPSAPPPPPPPAVAVPDNLSVQVIAAPQAPELATLIRRRDTTTLLTVDGTLLHRDLFTLAQSGDVLEIELPAGATLWAAKVDGTPVRPLLRGDLLAVPLGAGTGGERVVEVVAVLDKATPKGRSQLSFQLAQVQAPVLEHSWRLLLPESARYRFRAGDLRPAQELPTGAPSGYFAFDDFGPLRKDAPVPAPAAAAPPPPQPRDRVNVGGNENGVQAAYEAVGGKAVDEAKKAKSADAERPRREIDNRERLADLKQGLVGGVRPLPITIPQTGKTLLLSGLLPPARIGVELEVRNDRK